MASTFEFVFMFGVFKYNIKINIVVLLCLLDILLIYVQVGAIKQTLHLILLAPKINLET